VLGGPEAGRSAGRGGAVGGSARFVGLC
jgi:hypothetical protein